MAREPAKKGKYLPKACFNVGASGFDAAPAAKGVLGECRAFHRSNTPDKPYRIYNEYIAAELAVYFRLPVPTHAITLDGKKNKYFSAIDFNFDEQGDENAAFDASIFARALPEAAAGVVLFDVLIANADRHNGNIVVDDPMKPTAFRLIDHEHSLFGCRWQNEESEFNVDGVERLAKLSQRLAIDCKTVTVGNHHCLIDQINDAALLEEWYERIHSLPEWYIEDVCQNARSYGLGAKETKEISRFLIDRRQRIRQLVDSFQNEFKGIRKWQVPRRKLFD